MLYDSDTFDESIQGQQILSKGQMDISNAQRIVIGGKGGISISSSSIQFGDTQLEGGAGGATVLFLPVIITFEGNNYETTAEFTNGILTYIVPVLV